jgi:hypothetical protein
MTMRKSRSAGPRRSLTAQRPAFTTRQASRRHRRRPPFARKPRTAVTSADRRRTGDGPPRAQARVSPDAGRTRSGGGSRRCIRKSLSGFAGDAAPHAGWPHHAHDRYVAIAIARPALDGRTKAVAPTPGRARSDLGDSASQQPPDGVKNRTSAFPESIRGRGRPCGRRENGGGFGGRPVTPRD